ncbi:hypothetical protein [Streptomyces phaeoluteigriseus]|uniref:hypothetical protein n=1 Tax=Streptomyces phaeoluteigriseus TaxID=114686 RepID=UPI003EBA501A
MRPTGDAALHLATPGDRDRSTAVRRGAVDLGVGHSDSAVVRRGTVDLGVSHIDSAASPFPFSAPRSADELINGAPAPYPDDLLVAAKAGPFRERSGRGHGARSMSAPSEDLRGQVGKHLRPPGRDHLGVVHPRRMERESTAQHFGAVAELRRAGLVRHRTSAVR